MHILVTGSSGFIGSHLCRSLQESGNEVLAWDRVSPTGQPDPGRDLHMLDSWGRAHLLDAVEMAGQVYHLAGNADVGAYGRDSELMGQEWAAASTLLAACKMFNKPLVVASSAYARGCNTRYGRTKQGIETMCDLAGIDGSPVSVARIYNIYGPGQEKAITYRSTVVLNLYRAFKEGRWKIKTPNAKRDFVYVDDAIAGLLEVMKKTTSGESGKHEIASGQLTSIYGLGQTMAELMGHSSGLDISDAELAQLPPYYLAGQPVVLPTISLREGLRRTIAHLEETA